METTLAGDAYCSQVPRCKGPCLRIDFDHLKYFVSQEVHVVAVTVKVELL